MELNILDFIQNNMTSPLMNSIMMFFTTLGNVGIIWIITGATLLCFKKYRYWGAMILVALIFTFVIDEVVLKNLIDRPRPFVVNTDITLLIPEPSGSSFPSGHAATSFACAYVIFKCNKKMGIIALSVAAVIAFSRIYLYVHYPSDILVGAILGLICGEIVYIAFTKIRYRRGLKIKGELSDGEI